MSAAAPSTSAKPMVAGDGARGIQSRVQFPAGAVIDPQLTVSMNDESLFGYINAGHSRPLPAGMRVSFTSDRPGVVAVQRRGVIRTVGSGVATVTARVRYHGVSQSAQFVVDVGS
jgi:beta-glucosidase